MPRNYGIAVTQDSNHHSEDFMKQKSGLSKTSMLLPASGIALALLAAPLAAQTPAPATPAAAAPGTLVQAIRDGKIDLGLRLRFENSDDDAVLRGGDGLTLRTVLGYTTGQFHTLSVRLAAQDVRAIINDYNDGTGRPTAKTTRALIADPSATDLLEGYVASSFLPNTTIKVGRQIVARRQNPLNRYIGAVVWRQNWQTQDAVSLENKSLPDTVLRYAYSWNVNRIFTDKGVGARAQFDSDSHLFDLEYGGLPFGKLEGFAYLLDFANAPASSNATYGARFSGEHGVADQVNIVYAAEYAMQDDYGANPANVNEDYFAGELGLAWKAAGTPPTGFLRAAGAKFTYEQLDGNGVTAFQTPLATGHAFQGWADRLLTTPADGIEDMHVTVDANLGGFNVVLAYYDFSAANGNYDYGTEFNAQVTRAFNPQFTGGIKFASYDADTNATNVARNGALARDVSKFWVWVEFKY